MSIDLRVKHDLESRRRAVELFDDRVENVGVRVTL